MSRELAVAQWSRQLLQRDRRVTVEEAVVDCGGIYSTAPTSYLSFVARVPGFAKDDLDRALYRDRSLVRLSALRGSGFLIPLEMIDVVLAAFDRGDVTIAWAEKIVSRARLEKWRGQVLELLRGQILPGRVIRDELNIASEETEALGFLLSSMCLSQNLAVASGAKGWRSNQYGYALWEEWFVDHEPVDVDPDAARIEVARWYLSGHGPGTVDHFSWWAGMKKRNAAAALAEFPEIEAGVFDLPDPPPTVEPNGLRLLPVWDTALVAPKGRRRMVRSAHQPFVYDASGNLTSTVVRDGAVIGVWSRGGDNERLDVKVAGFEPMDTALRRAIEGETGIIAAALGVSKFAVTYVDEPVDLLTASRNRFMSPLKDS